MYICVLHRYSVISTIYKFKYCCNLRDNLIFLIKHIHTITCINIDGIYMCIKNIKYDMYEHDELHKIWKGVKVKNYNVHIGEVIPRNCHNCKTIRPYYWSTGKLLTIPPHISRDKLWQWYCSQICCHKLL